MSRASRHIRPGLVAAVALTATVLAAFAPPADAGKQSKTAAPPVTRDPIAQLLGHVRDLLDAGEADSAIAVLAPALAAGPAEAPLDPRLTRALVLASAAAGTPWEGVHVIEDMIRVRPGEVQLYAALGELELLRGRPEVALRHFQLAILADNRSPEGWAGWTLPGPWAAASNA
jgi:thioredoxin-like negative regulator of GroEL